MFPLGFGIKISIPTLITYLRPSELRQTWRSSSLGTGQSCFAKLTRSSQQETSAAQVVDGFGESYLQEAHPL